MRLNIFLFVLILSNSAICFSQRIHDTIYVEIDLGQIDSNGLEVHVFPPSNFESPDLYCFPRTIPGIYEYLDHQERNIKLHSISAKNDTIIVSPINQVGFFPINDVQSANQLVYHVTSSVEKRNGISAEDVFFIKDSVCILNWNYILGFFNQYRNFAYKIRIKKNPELWGSGTLEKKMFNDSVDFYFAGTYKSLIDHPVAYSIPDTIRFTIQDNEFMISTIGNDDSLNAEDLKVLLTPALEEVLSRSVYHPLKYVFIYISEYSVATPYLSALEHPNSTIVCYHKALLDNHIVIGSSIHELLHTLHAPLTIRSEVINELDLTSPKCDEHLWFYEGVTEYLSLKTLLHCGDLSHEEFLNELLMSDEYQQNINLSKSSRMVYTPRGEKMFDNFYTKGSLFALVLDIELLRLSEGESDLNDVVNKLHEEYNLKRPFHSENFVQKFAELSEVDIRSFIESYLNHKKKIDLKKITGDIGYSLTFENKDTTEWSFDLKKNYWIIYTEENKIEIVLKNSLINDILGLREVKIRKVDGEMISYFNYTKIYNPEPDKEISLLLDVGGTDKLVHVRPVKMHVKRKEHTWTMNEKYTEEYLKKFWMKD